MSDLRWRIRHSGRRSPARSAPAAPAHPYIFLPVFVIYKQSLVNPPDTGAILFLSFTVKFLFFSTRTVDYPVKTPQQLRPLLVGFRKAAGLTQAQLAARLGVTQQTYAQLEAKPESTSLDRLYLVLSLLNVSLVLTQASGPAKPEGRVAKHVKSAEEPAPAKQRAGLKSGVKSGTRGTAKTGAKRATGRAKPPPKSPASEPLPTAPVIKKRENW